MRQTRRVICLALISFLLFTVPWTYSTAIGASGSFQPYASFLNVPGVTEKEIASINALQGKRDHFIYGMTSTTEAFYDDNKNIRGFAALFCEWLTELFGIQFIPKIYDWGELSAGLENYTVDFTGELTETEERLNNNYFMTGTIAERTVNHIRLFNSTPLPELAEQRKLNFAFLNGTTNRAQVTAVSDYDFESFFVDDYETAYEMLKERAIDAFFAEGVAEAAFGHYGDVVSSVFIPLIYAPVSMTTLNPELEPVISVMRKLLEHDSSIHHMAELYKIGEEEYLKNRFTLSLTKEEQAYIEAHRDSVIPFLSRYDNYPLCFYNTHEKEWQGIAFDILLRINALTGLSFEILNKPGTEMTDLLRMLDNKEAPMITELLRSHEREDHFLWPTAYVFTDHFALISKTETPNISITDILRVKVGLIENAAFADLFISWFPDHKNKAWYSSPATAFAALNRGEIDMLMGTENLLLLQTNFHEEPGYKANIVFESTFESTFAFLKEEAVLCSIVDKALHLIDTKGISTQWMRKTYDYRAKLAQARLPVVFFGTAAVSLLILIVVLYRRNRNEGARLEGLVRARTAELDIAANERRQMLSKLEAVIQNYKGIIWSIDNNRIITTYNGQHLKKMGIKPSSVEGKHIDEMDREDNITMSEGVENTFTFGPQEWVNEINGRSFHSYTLPIHDNDGNIVGVVGSTDDVTEETQLRRNLEQAVVEAETSSRAKSVFLANMSHEIRTPMNSIIGFSELAMDDVLTPQTQERLNQIIENSKWLLQIINDILDISKVESGKMDIENVPFDLGEILTHCQSVVTPKAIEKNIFVQFYAEPFIGRMLVGDPTRLRQVIVNILSNAIKFTHVGSVKISATVAEMTDTTCTVLFEIRDSGIGMTPVQLEKIFKPFVQADSSTTRKYGGTGLGLPITKSIIELMGGILDVESTPGIGSKFSFKLTFDTIEAAVNTSVHTYSVGDIEKPIFSSATNVLVCEDNMMNQRVIQEHLKRVGLKVAIAENGKIGVDLVKSRQDKNEAPFDLIFMDMHMPEMDGLEAAHCIMEMGVKSPIVALTANVMSYDLELYKESGMDDCMSKPFTSQELWACLLKYLKPIASAGPAQKDLAESENEFQNQLKLDFYKANKGRFADIMSALEKNDIHLAHRMTHTLKSNAMLIGRPGLQAIAAEMESLLADGENNIQKWHIDRLDEELGTVLRDLEPLLNYAPKPIKRDGVFSKDEILALFKILKPLLSSNNTDCLDYIDDLRSVAGSEKLIAQMESFEFIQAADTLAELELTMEER